MTYNTVSSAQVAIYDERQREAVTDLEGLQKASQNTHSIQANNEHYGKCSGNINGSDSYNKLNNTTERVAVKQRKELVTETINKVNVIPVQTGIQTTLQLDPRLRGGDKGRGDDNRGSWGNRGNTSNHHEKQPTFSHSSSAEAALIKEQLNHRIKELAFELLGKPGTQTAKEWRYGNKGSVSIQVAGTKQGLYSNFEEGTSGNALKLIQDHFGLDHKQAFKWGADWLGNSDSLSHTTAKTRSPSLINKRQQSQKLQPLFPARSESPNLKTEKQLAYMVRGRQEVARFVYKDAEENIIGYVVRLEDRQGTKITPTLTYCRNEKGEQQWRWQGFGDDRPLYGLDQLAQKPEAHVLVVEGEKTAEAAKNPFPEYAVVTWSSGCGSVHKSDWSVLKDRNVILWPDNDKAGHNSVAKIKDILMERGNQHVHIVNLSDPLSPTLPHKWDLADPLPEGVSLTDIKKTLGIQPETQESQKLQESIPPGTVDQKVFAVAEKYALTEYVDIHDKTQSMHIQFAVEDFQKVDQHYKFESPPNQLSKPSLTGLYSFSDSCPLNTEQIP